MKKNRKKTVKKTVKKALLILFAAVVISVLTFIFVVPKVYLAHKYDTKITDYKVEKFYPGHFMYDINVWKIMWCHNRWIIKTDDRKFNVVWLHECFYDDYQMDEIGHWILEEFQKNINKNICHIPLSSYDLYQKYNSYREYKEKSYFEIIKEKNKVWKEDDIDELVKRFCNSQAGICFYFGNDIPIDDNLIKEIETTVGMLNTTYHKSFSCSDVYICLKKTTPKRRMFYNRYADSDLALISLGLEKEDVIPYSDLEDKKE